MTNSCRRTYAFYTSIASLIHILSYNLSFYANDKRKIAKIRPCEKLGLQLLSIVQTIGIHIKNRKSKNIEINSFRFFDSLNVDSDRIHHGELNICWHQITKIVGTTRKIWIIKLIIWIYSYVLIIFIESSQVQGSWVILPLGHLVDFDRKTAKKLKPNFLALLDI